MTDWSRFEWRDAREGDEGKPAVFESYDGSLSEGWDGSEFSFGFLRGKDGPWWIDDGGERWELCVVLAEKEEGKL